MRPVRYTVPLWIKKKKKKVNIQPKYTELRSEGALYDFPESHNTHTISHDHTLNPKALEAGLYPLSNFLSLKKHLISIISWV